MLLHIIYFLRKYIFYAFFFQTISVFFQIKFKPLLTEIKLYLFPITMQTNSRIVFASRKFTIHKCRIQKFTISCPKYNIFREIYPTSYIIPLLKLFQFIILYFFLTHYFSITFVTKTFRPLYNKCWNILIYCGKNNSLLVS